MNCCKLSTLPMLGMSAAVMLVAAGMYACSKTPGTQKPVVHRTPAFDALFGELFRMQMPGPCYATVVYFPSAREPGKFLPAPVFSAEMGKEEMLAVRTVIRGVDSEEFAKGIVRPFPAGADLLSLTHERGHAVVKVGGTFRAASMTAEERERAGKSLALTVAQFGKATEVDVTDAEGKVHFGARSEGVQTADPGNPRVFGVFAIKEDKNRPAATLSVFFDRPVFVEEIAFFPPGGGTQYTGNAYSTGFGMTVEFRPEPKVAFGGGKSYRVRLTVKDGKGRRLTEDREWEPKEVVGD
jgi:germination protein M